MNARDFLELAEDLVTGDSERHWRTAVSRAYYAAFHVGGALFEQCGFAVPEVDRAHHYLNIRLANSGHPDVVEAGRNLKDLRRARNRADYDLHLAFDQGWAMTLVSKADDVIRLMEQVSEHEPTRSRITQVMRDYERDVLQDVTWHGPASSSGAS